MQTFTSLQKEVFLAIFFPMLSASLFAQNLQKVSIAGIIADSTKQPLAGVTASVNNKAVDVSNLDGRFNIMVNKGSKVHFTSIGYNDFIYTANSNASNLVITLKSSSNTLDNVVVTALGITRQERTLGY